MLGNVITENCCCETHALFKEMNSNVSVNSDYTFMHMNALFSIYYTLFCTLPCARPSLSVKSTPLEPLEIRSARDPWQCQEGHPSFKQGSEWRAVKP